MRSANHALARMLHCLSNVDDWAIAQLRLLKLSGGNSGASPRRPTMISRRFPRVDRRSKRAGPTLLP